MTAMRRVALVLHALTPDDREWMLAQFDMQERESLRVLLDELERLGFVRDPALVREVTGREGAGGGTNADAPSAATGDLRLRAIAALPSSAAVAVLVEEPAAVLAFILSLHSWSWRSAVIEALGRAKREQVEAFSAARAARADDSGHALRAALLEELAARLDQGSHEMPAAARQAQWWRRFSWGRS